MRKLVLDLGSIKTALLFIFIIFQSIPDPTSAKPSQSLNLCKDETLYDPDALAHNLPCDQWAKNFLLEQVFGTDIVKGRRLDSLSDYDFFDGLDYLKSLGEIETENKAYIKRLESTKLIPVDILAQFEMEQTQQTLSAISAFDKAFNHTLIDEALKVASADGMSSYGRDLLKSLKTSDNNKSTTFDSTSEKTIGNRNGKGFPLNPEGNKNGLIAINKNPFVVPSATNTSKSRRSPSKNDIIRFLQDKPPTKLQTFQAFEQRFDCDKPAYMEDSNFESGYKQVADSLKVYIEQFAVCCGGQKNKLRCASELEETGTMCYDNIDFKPDVTVRMTGQNSDVTCQYVHDLYLTQKLKLSPDPIGRWKGTQCENSFDYGDTVYTVMKTYQKCCGGIALTRCPQDPMEGVTTKAPEPGPNLCIQKESFKPDKKSTLSGGTAREPCGNINLFMGTQIIEKEGSTMTDVDGNVDWRLINCETTKIFEKTEDATIQDTGTLFATAMNMYKDCCGGSTTSIRCGIPKVASNMCNEPTDFLPKVQVSDFFCEYHDNLVLHAVITATGERLNLWDKLDCMKTPQFLLQDGEYVQAPYPLAGQLGLFGDCCGGKTKMRCYKLGVAEVFGQVAGFLQGTDTSQEAATATFTLLGGALALCGGTIYCASTHCKEKEEEPEKDDPVEKLRMTMMGLGNMHGGGHGGKKKNKTPNKSGPEIFWPRVKLNLFFQKINSI